MKLILVVLFLVAISAAGYLFLQSDFFKPQEPVPVVVPTVTPTPTPVTFDEDTEVRPGWKNYTGTGSFESGKKFSIDYPSSWKRSGALLFPFETGSRLSVKGPFIGLGWGGFGLNTEQKIKKYPAGDAWVWWGTDEKFLNGYAYFETKNTNNYIFVVKNIPLDQEKYIKETFDQMLTTFKPL